jgi:hypothetical protein
MPHDKKGTPISFDLLVKSEANQGVQWEESQEWCKAVHWLVQECGLGHSIQGVYTAKK